MITGRYRYYDPAHALYHHDGIIIARTEFGDWYPVYFIP